MPVTFMSAMVMSSLPWPPDQPAGDTSEFSECMVVTEEIPDRIFTNGFD